RVLLCSCRCCPRMLFSQRRLPVGSPSCARRSRRALVGGARRVGVASTGEGGAGAGEGGWFNLSAMAHRRAGADLPRTRRGGPTLCRTPPSMAPFWAGRFGQARSSVPARPPSGRRSAREGGTLGPKCATLGGRGDDGGEQQP